MVVGFSSLLIFFCLVAQSVAGGRSWVLGLDKPGPNPGRFRPGTLENPESHALLAWHGKHKEAMCTQGLVESDCVLSALFTCE